MNTVSTTTLSGVYVGEAISDELLGINMRFHHNRTDPGSDFLKVLDQIDTNSIRYAGGTISEEHFDITDPDATRKVNALHLIHPELIPDRADGEPITRTVTPLSDYLSLVNELDGEPVVVLPTYRFFDQETRTLTENAEQDIRTFVRDLFEGRYGSVDELTIEIGNEYYQHRFNWTLQEFGQLQAQIAEWVDDEVRALGERDDLTLLAQAARNFQDNAALASHFSGLEEPTVDGVILHFYGTNSGGDPLQMGRNIARELSQTNQTWTPVLGADFDLAVTEWNVGENGEDTTLVNGTMRTAPLLFMFAEMVKGGVDLAQIWAARTDGPAGLSLRSESGDELTPTGTFFSMLSDSVSGLQLVDGGGRSNLSNNYGQHVGYTYTFEGDNRSVTYFASGTGQEFALSADLTAQIREGAFVYARTLDVATGDELGGYFSDAAVTVNTDVNLVERGGRTYLDTDLSPYALIELHVIYDQGVVLEGDRKNSIADDLIGGAFDDVLAGHDGWDLLRGMDGNDRLDGGNNRDYLRGQAGDDVLEGGHGRDRLLGGRGDDEVYGGIGNDRIRGHDDNDALYGGVGRDQIFGDNGNDSLFGGAGRDMLDGGMGDDYLDGGAGDDNLSGGAGNDRLSGDIGRDVLNGGVGEDSLDGGAGRDVLEGGAGNDVLTGGGGADTFIFASADTGRDTINDFSAGDRIDLSFYQITDPAEVLDTVTTTQEGVEFNFGTANTLVLVGVDPSTLNAVDFIF